MNLRRMFPSCSDLGLPDEMLWISIPLKSPFLGFRVIQTEYLPDFNLEDVFIVKNIFIMKNVTDFRKTVDVTGV